MYDGGDRDYKRKEEYMMPSLETEGKEGVMKYIRGVGDELR
jgi:hypothetical protein